MMVAWTQCGGGAGGDCGQPCWAGSCRLRIAAHLFRAWAPPRRLLPRDHDGVTVNPPGGWSPRSTPEASSERCGCRSHPMITGGFC